MFSSLSKFFFFLFFFGGGGPFVKCSCIQPKLLKLSQLFHSSSVGGAVASWLVRSSQDRAVRVRTLAGDIVSWARHLNLTVPLSTQVCKWVPVNLMLGVTLRWTSIPGESRTTSSRFMLQKPEISARSRGRLARMQASPLAALATCPYRRHYKTQFARTHFSETQFQVE